MGRGLENELRILEIRKKAFANYPFSFPTLLALRKQEMVVYFLTSQQPTDENAQDQVPILIRRKPKPATHRNERRRA